MIVGRLAARKTTSWPVFLFMIGLAVPWEIPLGSLRMSVYRIVLAVMILPCLKLWVSGKAGRIRTADVAVLLYCFWCTLSYFVNNGAASIQTSGITFIETAGSYWLARCYIRGADDFYNMVRLLFRIVAFLLPFAIFQCVTGRNILLELFTAVMATPAGGEEPGRWGLTRAYLVFEHPILFGVLMGSTLALAHLVLGRQDGVFKRSLRAGIIAATAFTSLSAGAMIVLAVHGFLLTWNRLLRATKLRWKILIGLLASVYVFVGLVANRSALEVATGFFVFDPVSYWFRKMIWDAGSASAMNHPLFGVGLNDWDRPEWMPVSIDNYWLSNAVTHGLPAAVLLVLIIVSIVLPLSLKKGLDEKLVAYRTGFLITVAGFCIALSTVALWNASLAMFFFMLGGGVWMLDARSRR
jgi:O-antigen ligase